MPITHELINGPAPLTSKPNQDSTEYTVEQQAIGFGIPAESLIGDPKTEALMRRMQDEAANVAMTCTGLSTLYAVTEAARGEG